MTRARDTLAERMRQRRKAERQALRVRAGADEFDIMRLSDSGFVIAADGRPPLRGYADIFRGDELILRGLVTCAWTDHGAVGYEFKHSTQSTQIAADYAPEA